MSKEGKRGKIDMEYLHLRIPVTLKEDLETLKTQTGVTINSICLEILWPGVKQRLKALK
jgi:hypothetical protein